MNINEIIDLFFQNVANTSLLEIIAVFFGLLSVWFAKKANILVYPTGIISVVIYVYICFHARLYADMGINGVYFVMSVYGWVMWSRKTGDNETLPVSFCRRKDHILNIIMFVFFFIGLSILLKRTDSDVPLLDSLTTAIFIVGMWLMALKRTENWIFWIIGDAISVPLYFYKGLVFSSFQYFVFLIIAVLGYIEWHKMYKENQKFA